MRSGEWWHRKTKSSQTIKGSQQRGSKFTNQEIEIILFRNVEANTRGNKEIKGNKGMV